ncbi:MAG: PepSY domain-containing protein, partial [Burkholderiaceae bacterium]|nr:PepSY domain-containing protein [Burkholderiaceae bacterium]
MIPAFAAGDTTQVIFSAAPSNEHAGHAGHLGHSEHQPASAMIVYVDPGTAKVQGSILEADRFRHWSRKLHSMFLQNDAWRWPIELSASAMLFLIISGVYLWWPREHAAATLMWSRQNTRRAKWRYLHSTLGLVLSALTLVIVLTGLTWSKFAGDHFRILQNSLAQNAARMPKTLHSSFPSDTPSQMITPQSAQSILEKVQKIAPPIQIQMTPPRDARDIWR